MKPTGPFYVDEACSPYPNPRYDPEIGDLVAPDYRATQWRTKVIEGLSERELREMTRAFLNLYPQDAEQELLWIGRDRCDQQRSDHELADQMGQR